MLAYNAMLLAESQENLDLLKQVLEWERLAFNAASKVQYARFVKGEEASIIHLHAKFYRQFRREHPEIPSQVVLKAQRGVLAAYRSIRSNQHAISAPAEKTALSLRLDKRLYSAPSPLTIRITTAKGRVPFTIKAFPKLQALLEKHAYKDPLIFERGGKLYVSLAFDVAPAPSAPKLALGVDLGVRVTAACSDGRLIRSKSFNARKRRIRHLKSRLKSRGSKSARRHSCKVRRREHNMTRNYSHHVANLILQSPADTIVLEKLKDLKKGRGRKQTKQTPFAQLRDILTYKAQNAGRRVLLVSPCYTSQTDPITGRKTGKRAGRRFYANNGLVYDADIAAAWNIGRRSKLPYLQGNLLAGQALVSEPIVFKSARAALQAPEFILG